MIERDWYNCHSGGWKGEITDEAFAHPAKFARGLIRRIYKHCLEQEYLKPGDLILDPFGGVSLGARDAIGFYWIGIELEQPFVDLGTGCDCTGISKADWVRFYGRWERVRHLDGRYWCPCCLSYAKQVIDGNGGQLSFFDQALSASYVRNSGLIPHTEPHHYTGNIELWGKNDGSAVLLQGDSRYLAQVLREAGAVVSSPPYARSNPEANSKGVNIEKQWKTYRSQGGGMSLEGFKQLQEKHSQGYGSGSANLANLPEGNHAAVVSSPPYADGCQHTGGDDPNPEHVQGGKLYGVGIAGAVSSPPYAESLASDDPDKRGGLYRDEKRRNDKTLTAEYGESEGQLGAMRVISSPPWEKQNACNDPNYQTGRSNGGGPLHGDYGDTAGQLGTETGDDFWSAARLIMQQVAMLLPPDAVSVWVCKRFVKDKQIVEFSQQWAALGEACGFETIEWIRAWLIEDRGAQYDLFGGLEKRQIARKSFFRRLYESKYPENSIDWEDVIIQRRLPNSV